MIILMRLDATKEQIDQVCDVIRQHSVEPLVLPGEDRVAIGIPASLSSEQRTDLEAALGSADGVSKVTQTSRPYKLASLEFRPQKTVVKVKGVEIGGGDFVVMGGR